MIALLERKPHDLPTAPLVLPRSKDVTKAMRMADRIEAGAVCIDNCFNAATRSPAGGFKQSGHGRKNGWEGMHCFRRAKSVWLAADPPRPDPFA